MRLKNLLLTLRVAITALPLAAQLQDGKVYRFVNKANTNIYIKSIKLNGEPYALPYIEHDDIVKGGTLTIEMSDTPAKWW